MRFQIKHYKLKSWTFARALLNERRDTTLHFLRITKRIGIMWDGRDE